METEVRQLNMKTIYLNKADMRSYALTPNVAWETIPVDVPDDFSGGGKYYDLESSTWIEDIIPEPTEEEIHEQEIAQAEYKKAELLSSASKAIEPLQDAVDLDMATDDEVLLLKEWKEFRVLVNRVDASLAPDIEWPEQPQ